MTCDVATPERCNYCTYPCPLVVGCSVGHKPSHAPFPACRWPLGRRARCTSGAAWTVCLVTETTSFLIPWRWTSECAGIFFGLHPQRSQIWSAIRLFDNIQVLQKTLSPATSGFCLHPGDSLSQGTGSGVTQSFFSEKQTQSAPHIGTARRLLR